ncbi:gp4 [Shigella phage Buco]|uniref:Uncharacterized protein n=1 Tax=Shigella phage Buco TaxID=2530183 RepID=A0A482JME6_9CAUD|nr:gp4 [Shigella phage Buco]QBP32904.1 hypothetical protein HRP29_gp4 [Shigella phage Buco]
MVQTITIIVKSALLLISSSVSEPIPFCTMEVQGQPGYELFENPEGGCKQLGATYKRNAEIAYPDAAVVLVVDGVSNQNM